MPRDKYKGAGINAINGGPYLPGEMIALFEEIAPPVLASAWVAVLADAFDMGFIKRTGDLVRPLLVVSRRLHGCKFDDTLLEVRASMTQDTIENGTARKPGMLSDDESRRFQHPPQPQKARKKSDKFIIRKDMIKVGGSLTTPPAAAPGAVKDDPLRDAILKLHVGEWIEIDPAPPKLNGLTMKCRGIGRHHNIDGLQVYRSEAGTAVIIRQANKEADPS